MFINSDKDLGVTECLNLYLYKKIFKDEEKISFINQTDYNNFKIDEKFIEEYNSIIKNTVKMEEIESWKKRYSKVVWFFNLKFKELFEAKVIHWNDRKKTEYFNQKLQQGHNFQELIKDLFLKKYGINLKMFSTKEGQYKLGECEEGIEIKNDARYKETNNLYIEFEEKSNGNNQLWVKSGILKNDNTQFYLIGDEIKFWILEKKELISLYSDALKGVKPHPRFRFVQIPTSKGLLIPCEYADKICLRIEDVIKNIKR